MINPFVIAAVVAVLAVIALLLRWIIAVRSLSADARAEYVGRQADRAHTISGVDAATFVRIYVDAYAPRWTLYASLALLGAIVITPPALLGLVAFWNWLTAVLAASDLFAPGYYPWMFYIFFGLVGAWALCGFLAARFHHQRAPEAFQAALMRARGEPLDDVVIKRQRPKWARRASVIAASKENRT
ncbi:hypothetical protein [Hyphobacterium sp.]|jgi:hypothetical protein|uniref:hypothetical protein n=1 Tax=Hyphobacterium sp. TaxID=2004662 RepID=UPI003BA9FA00